MKSLIYTLLFFPLIVWGYSPSCELGELFVDVQMESVFSDSKIFVDSNPKCNPHEILQIFKKKKPKDLKTFVETYFDVPKNIPPPPRTNLTMKEYINITWEHLERTSLEACEEITTLLPLPCPYIVPGERFQEMYYWDSFFTMLGLKLSGRDDLIESMLTDFVYLIDEYGFIPNGTRSYYLSRSQPPFFSLMILLSSSPQAYLCSLEKEYNFWMSKRFDPKTGLNYYSDECYTPRPEAYRVDVEFGKTFPPYQRPIYYHNIRATAESGWDFSTRWLDEKGVPQTIYLLPIDLNCLLYHQEKLLGQLYAERGREDKADFYQRQAYQRRCAIQKYFWNETKGFYFDYNYAKGKQTCHYTLAATFPLLFEIADKKQASSVAKILEECFLFKGGLVTTFINSGLQWDYPNGWAPLQWVSVRALNNYGHTRLADEIMHRWLQTNELEFELKGALYEKYDVVEPGKLPDMGEYPRQFGFGWTNGVALYFYSCMKGQGEPTLNDQGLKPK